MKTTSLIVGGYYRPPAKSIMAVLPAGARLSLRPEPTNVMDAGAIQVLVRTDQIPESQHKLLASLAEGQGFQLEEILAQPEWQIGYIPSPSNKKAEKAGLANNLDWAEVVPCEGRLGFSEDGDEIVMLAQQAQQVQQAQQANEEET